MGKINSWSEFKYQYGRSNQKNKDLQNTVGGLEQINNLKWELIKDNMKEAQIEERKVTIIDEEVVQLPPEFSDDELEVSDVYFR